MSGKSKPKKGKGKDKGKDKGKGKGKGKDKDKDKDKDKEKSAQTRTLFSFFSKKSGSSAPAAAASSSSSGKGKSSVVRKRRRSPSAESASSSDVELVAESRKRPSRQAKTKAKGKLREDAAADDDGDSDVEMEKADNSDSDFEPSKPSPSKRRRVLLDDDDDDGAPSDESDSDDDVMASARPSQPKSKPKPKAKAKPSKSTPPPSLRAGQATTPDDYFARMTGKPAPKPAAKPAAKPAPVPIDLASDSSDDGFEELSDDDEPPPPAIPAKVVLAKVKAQKATNKTTSKKRKYGMTVTKTTTATPWSEDVTVVDPNPEPEPKKLKHKFWMKPPPPKNLGRKPLPTGADMCLAGLTFVMSGVLDSIERDTAKQLITKYGGRVTGSISGKTSYLVLGEDGGESKQRKARERKKPGPVPIIDEDGLFELIRTRPAGSAEVAAKARGKPRMSKEERSAKQLDKATKELAKLAAEQGGGSGSSSSAAAAGSSSKRRARNEQEMLWVDKYAPREIDDLVGNKKALHGLLSFLRNFPKLLKKMQQEARDGGKASKTGKRAVLLAGPPGVGKTTAATLLLRKLGYDVIEANASDQRSKKTIGSMLRDLSSNTSLLTGAKHKPRKLALIMDEVDGISGNADRGGLQELVNVIKTTHIPIICIANDSSNRRIRTLKNYVRTIIFSRPSPLDMAPRVLEVCRRENVDIPEAAVVQICQSVGGDMRQVLNQLQILAKQGAMPSSASSAISQQTVASSLSSARKDLDQTFGDVSTNFFSRPRPRPADNPDAPDPMGQFLERGTRDYFVDAQMLPLLMHDMYPTATPRTAIPNLGTAEGNAAHLDALFEAAQSIADADLVSAQMRQTSTFSLMPLHGLLSCVRPGYLLAGSASPSFFPGWLGKNSTRGKNNRLLSELRVNTSRDTRCDSRSFALDYLPVLRARLVKPLARQGMEGIDEVIQMMDDYGLTREDWDVVNDMGAHFANRDDKSIDSKVKSAFTRTYNKHSHQLKVARDSSKFKAKKLRGRPTPLRADDDPVEDDGDEADDDGDGEEEDDNADSLEGGMIKQVKEKKKKKSAPRKKKASTKKKKKAPAKKKKQKKVPPAKAIVIDSSDEDFD